MRLWDAVRSAKNRREGEWGFSAIELLVVVLMISILTNALMWRYVRSRDKRDKVQTEGQIMSSLFRAAAAAGTAIGRNVFVDFRPTAVCSGSSITTPQIRIYGDNNYNRMYDAGTDQLVSEYTTPKYCDVPVGDKDVTFNSAINTNAYLRTTPTPWYALPAGITAQMVFVQRGDSWYNCDNKTSDPGYGYNTGTATKMSGLFLRLTTTPPAFATTDPRAYVSFGICTYTASINIVKGYTTLNSGATYPCM